MLWLDATDIHVQCHISGKLTSGSSISASRSDSRKVPNNISCTIRMTWRHSAKFEHQVYFKKSMVPCSKEKKKDKNKKTKIKQKTQQNQVKRIRMI